MAGFEGMNGEDGGETGRAFCCKPGFGGRYADFVLRVDGNMC